MIARRSSCVKSTRSFLLIERRNPREEHIIPGRACKSPSRATFRFPSAHGRRHPRSIIRARDLCESKIKFRQKERDEPRFSRLCPVSFAVIQSTDIARVIFFVWINSPVIHVGVCTIIPAWLSAFFHASSVRRYVDDVDV